MAPELWVRLHRKNPKTFWIPDEDEKQAIEPGVVVKVMFTIDDIWGTAHVRRAHVSPGRRHREATGRDTTVLN